MTLPHMIAMWRSETRRTTDKKRVAQDQPAFLCSALGRAVGLVATSLPLFPGNGEQHFGLTFNATPSLLLRCTGAALFLCDAARSASFRFTMLCGRRAACLRVLLEHVGNGFLVVVDELQRLEVVSTPISKRVDRHRRSASRTPPGNAPFLFLLINSSKLTR